MIIRFGSRQVWGLAEETLTRLGTINKMPEGLDSALAESFREQQVPQLLAQTLRERFFIRPDERDDILTSLQRVAPGVERLIIVEADHICEHIFDLLGSAPTSLGEKIDWHADFKTGHRWSPKTYYKRIHPAHYPGGYDIKVPWELSRCQHFARLGQAYWITGDEKYAREFVAQVEDWITSNPWPFGVNWASTMDVAIRVVNWLWGLCFFSKSDSLTEEFLLQLSKSLLIHGHHITGNLEGSPDDPNTGNHYLSNLVGLVYLGICCPYFNEAESWLTVGLRQLWNEMFKQVTPDGVDRERSVAYHRLVTELFLSAILLCQINDIEVPVLVRARLERMLEFIYSYTKPEGTVPIIGDADNGRVHRLAVWEDLGREWTDHRSLLAVGAVLFDRQDFARVAGDQWQEAIWLLGQRCEQKLAQRRFNPCAAPVSDLVSVEPASRAFPDAGIYVMRADSLYLINDAGPVGKNGYGAHAHNDTFSVELSVGGKTMIVDPGTHVYTADYEARNQFRSTLSHNIAMVDGEEINRFSAASLFRMQEDAHPRVLRWSSNSSSDFFEGEHRGYERLSQPVTHQRLIYLDKLARFWILRDYFLGVGSHAFEIFFHFDLGIEIALPSGHPGAIHARHSCGTQLYLAPLFAPHELKVGVDEGWVSKSYGRRTKAPVACYSVGGEVPLELVFGIYPCGDAHSPQVNLVDVVQQLRTAYAIVTKKREAQSGAGSTND